MVIAAVCKIVLLAHRFESYQPHKNLRRSITGSTAVLGIANVGSNPAAWIYCSLSLIGRATVL